MKFLLKSLFILVILFGSLTITGNRVLACGALELKANPQYLNANKKATSTISAIFGNQDGVDGILNFEIVQSPSSTDRISPASVSTVGGLASTTLYHDPSETGGVILIRASITVNINFGSVEYPMIIPCTFVQTVPVYTVKAEINGPDSISLFKTNTPKITLNAVIDPPGNGTYSWDVVNGSDKIQIIGDKTKDNIQIKAINKSTAKNDVDIKLTYKINSQLLEVHHLLTVRKPTKLTRENTQFIRHEVKVGRITIATQIGGLISCTLHDQFGDPMGGVPGNEVVTIDRKNSIPKKFIPIPITGSIVTLSNGSYGDVPVVTLVGKAPLNTHIAAAQQLRFGGYAGRNNFLITYSNLADSYPIQLGN